VYHVLEHVISLGHAKFGWFPRVSRNSRIPTNGLDAMIINAVFSDEIGDNKLDMEMIFHVESVYGE
jgi:hypothetical protein